MLKGKKEPYKYFICRTGTGFKNYREHYIAIYIPAAEPQTLFYSAADVAPSCLVQSSSGAPRAEGSSISARAGQRQRQWGSCNWAADAFKAPPRSSAAADEQPAPRGQLPSKAGHEACSRW